MKLPMKKSTEIDTIYVEYEGDAYKEAIANALQASGLESSKVTIIAIPKGSKLLKSIKGAR